MAQKTCKFCKNTFDTKCSPGTKEHARRSFCSKRCITENAAAKYVNKKFGLLTILSLEDDALRGNRKKIAVCSCRCGNIKRIALHDIKFSRPHGAKTISCGCVLYSIRKYGTDKRFYRIWQGIIARTRYREHFVEYSNVCVSAEWTKFGAFFDDMYLSYREHVAKFGENNTSIDRINTFGNYCRENCRWATNEEQGNNKSNTIMLDVYGDQMSLSQAEKITNKKLYTRWHKTGYLPPGIIYLGRKKDL